MPRRHSARARLTDDSREHYTTMKFRALSSFRLVNMIVFQHGMGGSFISNIFNLADSAMVKSCLEPSILRSMHEPVTGQADHERSHVFQTSKMFFTMLSDSCDSDLIDLWLADIEINVCSHTEEFTWRNTAARYASSDPDVVPHMTIYIPGHAPGLFSDRLTSANMDRIHAHALSRGVNTRFVVVTAREQDNLLWAHQRDRSIFGNDRGNIDTFAAVQRSKYQEAMASEHAVEFNIDQWLLGHSADLWDQIQYLLLGTAENQDLVQLRCRDFINRKRLQL